MTIVDPQAVGDLPSRLAQLNQRAAILLPDREDAMVSSELTSVLSQKRAAEHELNNRDHDLQAA